MMFRPRDSFDQHVLSTTLRITPRPAYLRYHHDVFGNCVGVARFEGQAPELTFESEVTLEHTPEDALDQSNTSRLNSYPFAYANHDLPDVHSSMLRLYADPQGTLGRWSRQFLQNIPKVDAIHVLTAMTAGICKDFE